MSCEYCGKPIKEWRVCPCTIDMTHDLIVKKGNKYIVIMTGDLSKVMETFILLYSLVNDDINLAVEVSDGP